MGYHAPKASSVVQKTPDPLINLGETNADMKNQRNKQGMLSSFLQGTRNRSAGFFANAFNPTKTTTPGSANI